MRKDIQHRQMVQRRTMTTRIITVWRLLFRGLLVASFLFVSLNWQRLLIYLRLAPLDSLFRHLGWLWVAFVAVLFLTAVIHELGHLIAGRFANLQFHLLIIGPVRLMQTNGRLRLSWQSGLGLFNGLASSIPQDNHNLRKRMILFAVGGPLASLLLAVAAISYALSVREHGRFPTEGAWMWEIALFLTAVSFLFFLSSMNPSRYQNGHLTDGGRIAMLLHNNEQTDRWCALVALNAADIHGVRPKDWDTQLIQQAISINDHTADSFTAAIMGYQYALDCGNQSQAETQLALALENQFGRRSNVYLRVVLEKAYYLAWVHQDAEEARQWMQQLPRNGRLTTSVHYRAEAAILFAEGHLQTATDTVQAGLLNLHDSLHKGTVQAEQVWLQKIQASINTKSLA